jgi:hypothetical protein
MDSLGIILRECVHSENVGGKSKQLIADPGIGKKA